MHDRPIEAEIQESLAHLRGDAGDDLRERAVAAMTAVRPARGRRRWVAVAAAAAVALVGLGFVPIPLGKTKGALDRAIASAGSARTAYCHRWIGGGTNRGAVEQIWMAEDGFLRSESYENGRLRGAKLFQQAWETDYRAGVEGKTGSAYASYNPCLRHDLPMPTRDQFLRQVEIMRYVADQRELPAPEIRVQERRETSLWRGEVVVVEVEVVQQSGETGPLGPDYRPGDIKAFRAEIDPRTNELLSERRYKVSNGARTLVYEATYDWNVEIPEEARHLSLPEGTTIERNDWWEARARKVVAQGQTPGWVVTVHEVDVDRHGVLALWVSRSLPPGAKSKVMNCAVLIAVEVVGDGGEQYTLDPLCSHWGVPHAAYEIRLLSPKDPERMPRAITLTLRPYDADAYQGQTVVLRDVPLPPRQEVENVKELWERK